MGSSGHISLQEAADLLGVHYMTAYRYVRTGRLFATKAQGQWLVATADLEAFQADPSPTAPKASTALALRQRLIANDSAGSWQICEAALASGFTPERVYRELLAPAMEEIGELWATGKLSIAQEHVATSNARSIVGRLGPNFVRRGRRRGAIVLGAAQDDHHALPVAFFADFLRARNFDVVDLGANTPGESFAEVAAELDNLVAIGLVVTSFDIMASARATIAAARSAGLRAPIVCGGRAVRTDADALALGADHGTSSTDDALDLFEELATQTTSEIA